MNDQIQHAPAQGKGAQSFVETAFQAEANSAEALDQERLGKYSSIAIRMFHTPVLAVKEMVYPGVGEFAKYVLQALEQYRTLYFVNVLKIDMKFLSGFKDNEKTRPILENIVSLTKQLKMLSLTEGVETAEQFSFLEAIGCDRAQGYLFSKPVPIETLRERISAGELKISPELSA